PFLTLFTTVSIRFSRIWSACLRLTPPASASFVTNCAFVIAAPPSPGGSPSRGKRAHLRQLRYECQENPRVSRASALSSAHRDERVEGRGGTPGCMLVAGGMRCSRPRDGPARQTEPVSAGARTQHERRRRLA